MADTEKSRQRVCLFGGTFDPIHMAHLRIANEALRECSLNRVLFIPAANPPHKTSVAMAPYEDRYHMVELACAPYPPFEASRLEAGPEKSYTIDTLERVRKDLGPEDQLYFLIGADAFDEIQTWHRWQELFALTEFLVVSRPGKVYAVPEGARVNRLENLELMVSSSEIRARLAAGQETPEVPAEVREYIQQRGLYGRTQEETATA